VFDNKVFQYAIEIVDEFIICTIILIAHFKNAEPSFFYLHKLHEESLMYDWYLVTVSILGLNVEQ
jgi:hypothetical protein